MTQAEEIKQLQVENAALKRQLAQASQQLVVTQKQLSELHKDLAALKQELQQLRVVKAGRSTQTANSSTPVLPSTPRVEGQPAPQQGDTVGPTSAEDGAGSGESLQEALAQAHGRIAELEAKVAATKTIPKWVKPAKVAKEKEHAERRKREGQHNHARGLEEATQAAVEHKLTAGPTCEGHLSGQHLGSRRQLIEIPAPPAVSIIEHHL